MSIFFSDTDCEMTYEEFVELGIPPLISMPYIVNNVECHYDMGKNFDFKKFFSEMRNGTEVSTCGLNKQIYLDYFEPHLKNGENILYVHFSSQMSGSFDYLRQAVDELKTRYPKQTVKYVDTLSISIGAGMIVKEARNLHRNGASDDEIIKFVEENRGKFAEYFYVDDLKHLRRGGRISGATAMFGTMLNIKPILHLNDEGKIVKFDKAKGEKGAIEFLFNRLKEIGKNVADYPVIVAHADNEPAALELEKKLRAYLGPDAVIQVRYIGPVIGTHCGPGTVGIAFHASKR